MCDRRRHSAVSLLVLITSLAIACAATASPAPTVRITAGPLAPNPALPHEPVSAKLQAALSYASQGEPQTPAGTTISWSITSINQDDTPLNQMPSYTFGPNDSAAATQTTLTFPDGFPSAGQYLVAVHVECSNPNWDSSTHDDVTLHLTVQDVIITFDRDQVRPGTGNTRSETVNVSVRRSGSGSETEVTIDLSVDNARATVAPTMGSGAKT